MVRRFVLGGTLLSALLYAALYNSLQGGPEMSRRWYISSNSQLGDQSAPDQVLEEDVSQFLTKNRSAVAEFVQRKLRSALRQDKGSGCHFPRLDPFSADAAWYDRQLPPLQCGATDWVKCYVSSHNKCRVVDSILASTQNLKCKYRDILYQDDFHFTWGSALVVTGAREYTLIASDVVDVSCSATNISRWYISSNSQLGDQSAPDQVLEEDVSQFLTKNRSAVAEFVQRKLRSALRQDKGSGCHFPRLDPFSADAAWYDRQLPPLQCGATDWVKCYVSSHNKCRVVDSILASTQNLKCKYRDILYQDDFHFTWGSALVVTGAREYTLIASDVVDVSCSATNISSGKRVSWSGIALGLRRVPRSRSPEGREHTYNVVILAFDSTPRSGFIRLMPKTWRVINEELKATVMEGYNIVGDGTVHALFPLLMGHIELELPDVRRNKYNTRTLDDFPIMFRKMNDDGYRTAFLEDMPLDGTFVWRFNGFRRPPADHYLRHFLGAQMQHRSRYNWTYCLGDTPQFKLLINITEQLLELDGKHFIFTFIGDITHDDFPLIQWADDDTAAFLRRLLVRREDTLIVVMGDHGPRYAKVREKLSIRGKLDERLPLLAVRLPDALVRARPLAQRALELNAQALMTAHDLHATVLDVVDMREHWNPYKIEGADFPRGMTLLEPIPRNRSCSEAGIEAHWCTCLVWLNVSTADPLYNRSAQALVDYINRLMKDVRSACAPRTLMAARSVLRQRANSRLLSYAHARDHDTYLGKFYAKTNMTTESFQVGIEVGPGHAFYEATLTFVVAEDRFLIQARDISRVNAYREESDCIMESHPHLAPYCYCLR